MSETVKLYDGDAPTDDATALVIRTYDGAEIAQRPADRYLNATAMCKANGKRLTLYLKNASTQGFLAELSSVVGIPTTELVQIRQGGSPGLQGTWVHPDVAIHMAQWCSPKFAVQVSRWVREIMTTGSTSIRPPEATPAAAPVTASGETSMALAMIESTRMIVGAMVESNRDLVQSIVRSMDSVVASNRDLVQSIVESNRGLSRTVSEVVSQTVSEVAFAARTPTRRRTKDRGPKLVAIPESDGDTPSEGPPPAGDLMSQALATMPKAVPVSDADWGGGKFLILADFTRAFKLPFDAQNGTACHALSARMGLPVGSGPNWEGKYVGAYHPAVLCRHFGVARERYLAEFPAPTVSA